MSTKHKQRNTCRYRKEELARLSSTLFPNADLKLAAQLFWDKYPTMAKIKSKRQRCSFSPPVTLTPKEISKKSWPSLTQSELDQLKERFLKFNPCQ